MWIVLGIFIVLIFLVVFEFRFRPPDRIVLHEAKGRVKQRKGRVYPRHFSLAVPSTVHKIQPEIEAEARGRLEVRIGLVVTVAASPDYLPDLIRVAGWEQDAVAKSAAELNTIIDSLVQEYAAGFEIEELSSDKLSEHLNNQLRDSVPPLGLELLSVYVQTIEPLDNEIADAMRRQEAERIMEQTEILSQKVRVAAAKAKVDADEEIALSQHKLDLKKLELQKIEEEKQADLAQIRLKEELKSRKLQLEVDREEAGLIKENPELVLLTPQVARLAEASQNLRNAKTVVSLSPNDFKEDSPVAALLQSLIRQLGKTGSKPNSAKDSQ